MSNSCDPVNPVQAEAGADLLGPYGRSGQPDHRTELCPAAQGAAAGRRPRSRPRHHPEGQEHDADPGESTALLSLSTSVCHTLASLSWQKKPWPSGQGHDADPGDITVSTVLVSWPYYSFSASLASDTQSSGASADCNYSTACASTVHVSWPYCSSRQLTAGTRQLVPAVVLCVRDCLSVLLDASVATAAKADSDLAFNLP